MKHLLTTLVLAVTGYSLHAAGWLSHPAPNPPSTSCVASDPFTSDAAFRHRTGQPNHWRAMVMQK